MINYDLNFSLISVIVLSRVLEKLQATASEVRGPEENG